jgi:hypothetical protein
MGRACSTNRENRNAYRILVGKPEGKRPLAKPRCRSVDDIKMKNVVFWDVATHLHSLRCENLKSYNIKMGHREIEWDGMDWIELAQDKGPVEGSCEHGNKPSGSIKCWEILE